MPPERILEAITTGSMKTNAANLTDPQKQLLAEFMGGRKLDKEDVGDIKHMPNACAAHPPVRDLNAPSWNGWGDLSNTRFQPAKAAGLTAGRVSRLRLKWAFGFPGATALYGQTIVDGRVFVSSNAGYVYSLDAETGCLHWSFRSPAVVRSGITVGPRVFFAGGMDGVLRAVSPENGSPIWEFNTAQEFKTVNGVAAKGGSIGAGGPTIANGMVFVGSGYVGFQNGVPGNVLLAFAP
jgi:polyvinyl alcohol dehydrogenase (cytochrome)